MIDGTLHNWIKYIMWLIPGALIAAAIDIGQVQTSSKLMHSKTWLRRAALVTTSTMLAIAGYYLQWFHLIHHMPALEFGAGLAPETQDRVRITRDAAIYIIPLLLPISTILYTMSAIGEEEITPTLQQQPTPEEIKQEVKETKDFLAKIKVKANGHQHHAADELANTVAIHSKEE